MAKTKKPKIPKKPAKPKKPPKKKGKGSLYDGAGSYCQGGIIMNEELYNEKFAVINHRLANLEQEYKEFKHKAEKEHKEMKQEIRENSDLKYAIQSLSDVVAELKVTVNDLNNRDGATWRQTKWLILSGVIMSILGFILGQILQI